MRSHNFIVKVGFFFFVFFGFVFFFWRCFFCFFLVFEKKFMWVSSSLLRTKGIKRLTISSSDAEKVLPETANQSHIHGFLLLCSAGFLLLLRCFSCSLCGTRVSQTRFPRFSLTKLSFRDLTCQFANTLQTCINLLFCPPLLCQSAKSPLVEGQ